MIRPEFIIESMREYSPEADVDMIWRAYAFAARCHKGQKRVSGEPYLSHPLEVANILTQLNMGHVTVAVGLLHDTVEDGDTSLEEIKELFGEEVMTLVDGVTKISLLKFPNKEEEQAENIRKMILAMCKDVRVILVKFADRIHNMRTLHYLSPARQKAMAKETIDIYAPLANRLGIGWIKTELENNCLMYLHPAEYKSIKEMVSKVEAEREGYIGKIIGEVGAKLKETGVDAQVMGRPKHYYSIYSKMASQKISFEEVFDLMGIRLITKTKKDCYAALGLLHEMYKPIPGKLDDYIALPKQNMYQSLHTTIVGPMGKPVEFQIRTQAMHLIAEEGIAAHWRYKEGHAAREGKHDDQILWLRRLLEWQKDVKDPRDFLEYVKIDLFPDEVYVFTPNQDVKALPHAATPLDFAFSVHTDIGLHCVGAKINGKLAPLRQDLKNGDIVEILTNAQHWPNRDWLKFVKTSKARTKIASFLHQAEKSRAVDLGREFLSKEIAKLGLDPGVMMAEEKLLPPAQASGYMSQESLYTALGLGRIKMNHFLAKLAPVQMAAIHKQGILATAIKSLIGRKEEKGKKSGVSIQGMDDLLIRFAQCCNPVPGDAIHGFISRGRGLIVHTVDCPNALTIGRDSDRRVDVNWDIKSPTTRVVMISVETEDRPGILAKVTGAIADLNSNITDAHVVTGEKNDKGYINISLEVADLDHLRKLMNSVSKIKGVISVERVKDRTAFTGGKKPKSS
jgi:GTP pyrophosphokinase